MLISSKIEKAKYKTNKILEKDDKNNLRMDSIVKTDIVYRILNNQILFKLGTIDIDKVDEYKKNFYNCNKQKRVLTQKRLGYFGVFLINLFPK